MFTHIAIFKWKSDVKPSEITAALNEVEALQEKIPGIIEISAGENQSRYGEDYTHVVLIRGDSEEAIEAYRNHPDHQAVASRIEALEEHGIGIDFETK